MTRKISRAALAKIIAKSEQRQQMVDALLQTWELEFRADFARDRGSRFESLLERFGLPPDAQEMLEGTIDFVTACTAFPRLDAVAISAFLADQRYDGGGGAATYELTFDMYGFGTARLLVAPDMNTVDLEVLFEHPWERLDATGFSAFWISRSDGDELSEDEIEELARVIRRDIWFDGREDVDICFDRSSTAGALAVDVYEINDDEADDETASA